MDIKSFKEKGVPGPANYFTGTVHVNTLITPEEDINAIMAIVSFDAKARTNWHTHTTGQILAVVEGKGYYQEEGQPKVVINEGDVVKIPKDVKHWHGASPDSEFTHIAINPNTQGGVTVWLEPVTDEEYNG